MANQNELNVNARRYRIEQSPERSLLSVLRDELDLTGAKYGCGEGQCGACTVLINGQPVRSCVTPISAAAGRQIITVEGIEQNGQLHPLQDAFIEAGAMQCAYCIPGMIMSGVGLLNTNTNPTDQQIVQALEGNICRCGTYSRIVVAVKLAAQAMRSKR